MTRGQSVAEWLATVDTSILAEVIRDYGEERFAQPIAKAIDRRRQERGPFRTTRELAEVVGASEASISRLSGSRAIGPDSKEGELARLFLRMFRSLDSLVGGDETKARRWLQAENEHLGGVPAKLILRVEGLVDVVQYLDSMRGRL